MERAEGLQVVLGAGGGTGRAIADELVGQGRQVRAVSRNGRVEGLPASVEQTGADLYDSADAARAVAGASVVYHAAQPPYAEWAGNFERMNDAVARAAGGAGARLVFADNLYMYGPGASPMRETTPQRATDRKGALRIRLAADLLARHQRGEVEVAIGRSSDYFGPFGVNTGAGERAFGAIVTGKPAAGVGSVDKPHTFSYLPDLARAMVILGDRDEAAGRAWHLPVTDPITVRALMERAAAVAGVPAKVRVDGPLALTFAGLFVPMVREVRVVLYQWTAPFVSDWSAFEAAFGPFERTPLDEALAATVAWWRTEMAARSAAKAA
ncbi:MAG TPA: NAD-dependent epimerase/dehydratase family protein [Candidatus Limnocylindrales bacterium]|nr:NAD-dependent epimerase/dehydratase family protein [Candidatus Limnocylindrales bacterium]